MQVELRLADADDAQVIRNLWPLYQHDLSAFDGSRPNRHGLFGVDDDVRTPQQQAESLSPWFEEPEALFPYLIVVDGRPAGFDLVAARSRLPRGIDADFVVHEFFVLHAERGTGAAERAARAGFERHRGRWEVVTSPNHARAVAFWRRVVAASAPSTFSEREADHVWGRKVVFEFDNSSGMSFSASLASGASPPR